MDLTIEINTNKLDGILAIVLDYRCSVFSQRD